ncbi:MAG: NADPH-dependent F420 reductase [Dehalococcoidia bacterium]|nr:NADPH-dependent F420 reductase [Dehalococcoidia bacterium]
MCRVLDDGEVTVQVGIIGAGNVGHALGLASVRAGHEVRISASQPSEAESVAQEVGAQPAGSNAESIQGADVVILAVPFEAVEEITSELGSALNGKVVIDVTNRFAPEQLDGPSNAERTQMLVPDARVVKAFNTIFAANQSEPSVDGVQLDGFVAGDDAAAKDTVISLVESMGFRAVDTGPLAMARALEGMGVLNISLNASKGWPWKSGWKLVGPTEPAQA